MLMNIVVWAQVAVFTHVMFYDVDWDRLGTPGRAPRTRETLPDFREPCRVTRHSRVFRGLTVVNGPPGFEASHMFIPCVLKTHSPCHMHNAMCHMACAFMPCFTWHSML